MVYILAFNSCYSISIMITTKALLALFSVCFLPNPKLVTYRNDINGTATVLHRPQTPMHLMKGTSALFSDSIQFAVLRATWLCFTSIEAKQLLTVHFLSMLEFEI